MKITTNYNKKWDSEGCVYNQNITIKDSVYLLNEINNAINEILKGISKKTLVNNKDNDYLCYLKPLNKGMNYLTHTQRNFLFTKILHKEIKDRNTTVNFK